MNCRSVEPLLSREIEAGLSASEARVVRAHVERCPECRRVRDGFTALGADLRTLPVRGPRADLEQRIAERWMAQNSRGRALGSRLFMDRRTPALRPALLTAVAAAVLLGIGSWVLGGWDPDQTGAESPEKRASQSPVVPPQPLPVPPPMGSLSGTRSATSLPRHPVATIARDGTRPAAVPARVEARECPPRRLRSTDDLPYLNEHVRRESQALLALTAHEPNAVGAETLRAIRVGDDFVAIPWPRIADADGRQVAAAIESTKREAAIVDTRLVRPVTLGVKATALSDLCDRLRADTGIHLTAGSSVADEKVTLFCEKTPLRDVMRQLSRPFGYAWIRSKANEYRYELVQDLRSQLLEEELRSRDRNAALLALDREITRFRPYLGLTPNEALERSRTAPPAEKKLLETLGSYGWGAIQMYVRLSPQELAALRAGQELRYSNFSEPGIAPLPPDVARAALQPFREWYLAPREEGYAFTLNKGETGALPVPAVPDVRASVAIRFNPTELGRLALHGAVGYVTVGKDGRKFDRAGPAGDYVVGSSHSILTSANRADAPDASKDPAMRSRIILRPQPSWRALPIRNAADGERPEPKVTSADVLEALHRAARIPIVADYYTRLHKPGDLAVQNLSLSEAVSQLARAMRLRWRKEGDWLQFRSTSYYDDRLKEVPNRLLARWSEARRRQGALTIDDLCEIVALPDAQLDGQEMAEGARDVWGLAEWDLARSSMMRSHLRFLAGFTPNLRQEAMSTAGLPFARMPLAQQQRFLSMAVNPNIGPPQSIEELTGGVLRVEYSVPGGFQWGGNDFHAYGRYTRWLLPLASGEKVPRPVVRARTREATLMQVRQLDLRIRNAMLETVRRGFPLLGITPRPDATLEAVDEEQIVPTTLDLVFAYIPSPGSNRPIHVPTPRAFFNAWP